MPLLLVSMSGLGREKMGKLRDERHRTLGLTTRMFNSSTGGFCAPEDKGMAVSLLPGTELYFAG